MRAATESKQTHQFQGKSTTKVGVSAKFMTYYFHTRGGIRVAILNTRRNTYSIVRKVISEFQVSNQQVAHRSQPLWVSLVVYNGPFTQSHACTCALAVPHAIGIKSNEAD